MDWINNYLNKPWVAYARGPHAYDCWGLVISVLKNHFNSQPIDSHDEVTTDNREEITQAFYDEIRAGRWQQSPSAKHGSVVVCWIEQDGQLLVRHVGLYLSTVMAVVCSIAVTLPVSVSIILQPFSVNFRK